MKNTITIFVAFLFLNLNNIKEQVLTEQNYLGPIAPDTSIDY